jgi:hypothetical protein
MSVKENEPSSSSSNFASLSSTTQTNNTGNDTQGSNDSSLSLAREETNAVNRSKVLVLAVIAIAATACGTATYLFTTSGEKDDFSSAVRQHDVQLWSATLSVHLPF